MSLAFAPSAKGDPYPNLSFGLGLAVALAFTQGWVMAVTGPEVDPDVSPAIRNMFLPFFGCALVLAGLNWRTTFSGLWRTPALCACVALVFVSTLWSIDPDVTWRRAVAVLITTLAGIAIGARFSWPRLVRLLATTVGVAAVGSLLMALALPSYGIMHLEFPGAWRGVWYGKNLLGQHMNQGFVFCVAAAIIDRGRVRLWSGLAALCVFLVVMSTSKTALAAVVLASAAMMLTGVIQRGPISAIVGGWFACSLLLLLGVLLTVSPNTVLGLLGRDATLSGRTGLWAAILRQVAQRPWTGFGYGAVWEDKSLWGPLAWISKDAGWKNAAADSSWMELLLGLGLGGAVLFGLCLLGVWRRAVAAVFTGAGGYVAFPFLLVYTLTTFTESSVLSYNDFGWMAFCALAARLAMDRQPGPGAP